MRGGARKCGRRRVLCRGPQNPAGAGLFARALLEGEDSYYVVVHCSWQPPAGRAADAGPLLFFECEGGRGLAAIEWMVAAGCQLRPSLTCRPVSNRQSGAIQLTNALRGLCGCRLCDQYLGRPLCRASCPTPGTRARTCGGPTDPHPKVVGKPRLRQPAQRYAAARGRGHGGVYYGPRWSQKQGGLGDG